LGGSILLNLGLGIMRLKTVANILIVDDQPHLQELSSQQLVDEGHKVMSLTEVLGAHMNNILVLGGDESIQTLYAEES
jgi:CheY-like chemotaxis protein